MAQINLFGEVGIIKTIGGLIDRAREREIRSLRTSPTSSAPMNAPT